MIRTIVSLIFFFSSIWSAHASCSVAPFRFTFGGETSTVANTAAGSRCNISAVAMGTSTFTGLSIVQNPKHGKITPLGKRGVTYIPANDFHGEDNFAFSISGQDIASSGTATISVTVHSQ
jgi:hypothetical protein